MRGNRELRTVSANSSPGCEIFHAHAPEKIKASARFLTNAVADESARQLPWWAKGAAGQAPVNGRVPRHHMRDLHRARDQAKGSHAVTVKERLSCRHQ